jgi:hypothetical protein
MNEASSANASREKILRVAEGLKTRNFEAIVVETGVEARKLLFEMIPPDAEVHSGKSKTLEELGVFGELQESGRYNFLRSIYLKMDRQKQAREIRKLVASPDFMLGSANAVTEDGILVVSSATGSQIGPYAMGAGRVILVIGNQKIVPNVESALARIREQVLPWESARVRETMGIDSFVGKTLIYEREWVKGRVTVILVNEPIGI